MEFLMEANLISMFGGIIGVAAGFALIPAVEMFNIRCEPMVLGGILALVFAVITGQYSDFIRHSKHRSLHLLKHFHRINLHLNGKKGY
jgi:putative ABC transport system permease protein